MNELVEGSRVRETEVVEKAKRRRYTAEYKQRILLEADGATERGAVGALLRREGLYSSLLAVWRQQRDAGELSALTPKRRGPKAVVPDARDRELSQLQKKLAVTELRLKRAEGLLELQKKVSEILGLEFPPPPPEEPS